MEVEVLHDYGRYPASVWFRIPFTRYFVARILDHPIYCRARRKTWRWPHVLLVLVKKEWSGSGYIWTEV